MSEADVKPDTEANPAKMLDAISSVDMSETPDPVPVTEEAPAAPVQAPAGEAEPTGVLAKDGKTVIPFSVLQETRQEADLYKQKVGALEERLSQLEKAPGGDVDMSGLPTDEELADYPEDLRDSVLKLRDTVLALKGSVQDMTAEKADNELNAKRAYYNQVLDQFPRLKAIEEAGGPRFEQGKLISERIRNAPGYDKTQPLDQHLKEVDAELAKAVAAENALFGITPKLDTTTPPTAPGSRPLPEKIPIAPASLSDIQGGVPPALSEADAFVKMNDIDAISVMAKAKQKGNQHFEQMLTRVYR